MFSGSKQLPFTITQQQSTKLSPYHFLGNGDNFPTISELYTWCTAH